MNVRNLSVAMLSAVAGGTIAVAVMSTFMPLSGGKSDRLSGPAKETAFLPERFGVPNSEPIVK